MIPLERQQRLREVARNARVSIDTDPNSHWRRPFHEEWTPEQALEVLSELRSLQQLNRLLVLLYGPLAKQDHEAAEEALEKRALALLTQHRDRALEPYRPRDPELAEEYDRMVEVNARLVSHSFVVGLAGKLAYAWKHMTSVERRSGAGFSLRCWLGACERKGLLK